MAQPVLSTDPFTQALLLLFVATLVSYAALHALWRGCGVTGAARGAVVALPVTAFAIWQTSLGHASIGIAALTAASVLVLTLGIGVASLNHSPPHEPASSTLRGLLPLTACVFLIGFSGALTLRHALALGIVGAMTVITIGWARPTSSLVRPIALLLGAALAMLALHFVIRATGLLSIGSGSMVVTPMVVLLVTPALLLSLLGLLAGDAKSSGAGSAMSTIAGFVTTCLGIAMPLVIVVAHAINKADGANASPPVQMSLATWRVDAVFLVMLSVLLLPVASNRFKLGRVEALLLIGLYLLYASAATRAGVG